MGAERCVRVQGSGRGRMPQHALQCAAMFADSARYTQWCMQCHQLTSSPCCPLDPSSRLQRWKELSGQQLLERYGMTETGMILSNPYQVIALRGPE